MVWALLSGLCWGLALPDLRGGVCLLLGAWCAGRALGGRPLYDAALGLVAGLTWQALALAWTVPALRDHGLERADLAAALQIAVQGAGVALPWGLAGVLRRVGLPVGVAFGLAWLIAVEPLSWCQPLPFPPALMLAGTVVAVWPAAVGGAPLLTALAVGVGAGMPTPGATLVLGTWFFLGSLWVLQPETGPVRRVGVIQPDIGPFDARRASTAEARAGRLVQQLRAAANAEAAFLVAPESAWPWPLGGPASVARLTDALAGLPPVVLGSTFEDGPTNSLVVVADGAIADRFDKVLRVPGTERRALGFGRDVFAAGTRPRALRAGDVRVGPLVCYEDLHPVALRDALAHGPHVLLAAAHDGWMADGPGAAWHLAAARLAAVVTGRPVLRPTTSGWSAVIDTRGELLWWAPVVDGDGPKATGRHGVVEVHLADRRFTGVAAGPWWAGAGVLGTLVWVVRRRPRNDDGRPPKEPAARTHDAPTDQ